MCGEPRYINTWEIEDDLSNWRISTVSKKMEGVVWFYLGGDGPLKMASDQVLVLFQMAPGRWPRASQS